MGQSADKQTARFRNFRSRLKLEMEAKLSEARVAIDAVDGTKVARPDGRTATTAADDVVEVTVKNVIELRTERKVISSLGADGEVLQQARIFVGRSGTTQVRDGERSLSQLSHCRLSGHACRHVVRYLWELGGIVRALEAGQVEIGVDVSSLWQNSCHADSR
jgi:hypothetical protein